MKQLKFTETHVDRGGRMIIHIFDGIEPLGEIRMPPDPLIRKLQIVNAKLEKKWNKAFSANREGVKREEHQQKEYDKLLVRDTANLQKLIKAKEDLLKIYELAQEMCTDNGTNIP